MEMLVENPLPAIFAGIVAAAVVGVIFVNTRNFRVLWALPVIFLLTLGGVALEWLIVTEREEVEQTLDGIAAALESNDLDAVLRYVSPQAAQTRQRAAWAMGIVTIRDVRMRNREVRINRLTSPPTAEAEFNGTLFFDLKQPQIGMIRDVYLARFVVQLESDGNRWLVTDHIEYQPLGR